MCDEALDLQCTPFFTDELTREMLALAEKELYSNRENLAKGIALLSQNRGVMLQAMLKMGEHHLFLTARTKSGRLVGFMTCEIHTQLRCAEITDTLVERQYRQRGIGARFVEIFRLVLRKFVLTKYGVEERWPIKLEVSRADPSSVGDFWKRRGFVEHENPAESPNFRQFIELFCGTCGKDTKLENICTRCKLHTHCGESCAAASKSKCPTKCISQIVVGEVITNPVTNEKVLVLGGLPDGLTQEKLSELFKK